MSHQIDTVAAIAELIIPADRHAGSAQCASSQAS